MSTLVAMLFGWVEVVGWGIWRGVLDVVCWGDRRALRMGDEYLWGGGEVRRCLLISSITLALLEIHSLFLSVKLHLSFYSYYIL